jgi:DNA-directed RNA polymerase subunit H (RpoH/RPB5)
VDVMPSHTKNVQVSRLQRTHIRTLFQMLYDRGFQQITQLLPSEDFSNLLLLVKADLHTDSSIKPCVVLDSSMCTVNVDTTRQLTKYVQIHDIGSVVVITNGHTSKTRTLEGDIVSMAVSSFARQDLARLNCQCIDFETLAHPIVEHKLCCATRRVTVSELEKIFKANKQPLILDKLPTISIDDPIVAYYGWQLGDYIEVIKNYPPLPQTPSYEKIVPKAD